YLEDGARGAHVGCGDKGAAVGKQVDQLVMIESREHVPDLPAPGVENLAQRQLVELGSGRQPLVDDRIEDVVVDVVGAADLWPVAGIAEADKLARARFVEHHASRLCDGLRAINAKD